MSMPRAVRHINETRVLDSLFRSGAMSRADLARTLGITRSTAGSLVSGLAQQGLILDGPGEPAGRGRRTGRPGSMGRPGSYVRLNARHAFFLGADVGIGHLTVVALDFTAEIVARAFTTLEATDPPCVVDALVTLIHSVIARLPAPEAVWGLGVTVPGLLDLDGNVLRAPILGWRNVPILRMLRAQMPELSTIVAENDANALAVAELYRAGAAAPSEALYILLDAGVGGGIVSNGTLLRGHDGYAAEIGHIYVGDRGYVALSTLPGSLESFTGRAAVLARHRFHGGTGESLDAFTAALDARDTAAIATLADWSHYLGRGIATLTSVLNPEKIVLGGPLAALHRYAEADILASVATHLLPNHPMPGIEASSLGSDGPAVGAASMMHQSMLAFDEDLVFRGKRTPMA